MQVTTSHNQITDSKCKDPCYFDKKLEFANVARRLNISSNHKY